MEHTYYRKPPSEIIEILVSGSGPAYAFRDGKVYEVRWNIPSQDSVLYLTYEDGTPFPYKPGNTWYQVVGQSTSITSPDDETWRFDFLIP
jgi:phage baseplate assembly protein gpV